MTRKTLITALLCTFLAIAPAAAQTAPDTIAQVVTQSGGTIYNAGPSDVVRNVGQTSHLLTYCASTGGGGAISLAIEGSFDNSNWQQISNYGSFTNNCETLYATGYWPFVRVNIYTRTAPAGVTSLYYSGSKQNIIPGAVTPPFTPTQPVAISSTGFANVVATSSWTALSARSYFYGMDVTNLTAGTLYISGSTLNTKVAVPAGSTYQYRMPQPLILANLSMTCSTSSSANVDPAANTCAITVFYRDQPSLKTLVDSAGTPSRTGNYPTF